MDNLNDTNNLVNMVRIRQPEHLVKLIGKGCGYS